MMASTKRTMKGTKSHMVTECPETGSRNLGL